jgi:hypothetical protein
MNLAGLKSFFMKVMIGCLVAAGFVAVVAVLTGEFSDILGRSLGTICLIALHALVSFSYIDFTEKQKSDKELSFFNNTTFVILVLSFFTSLFGVWGLIDGELIAKLYATYFVLLFAVLHGEVLYKITGKDDKITNIVYTNYAFMVAVVLMILPVIYADAATLGDFYYRLLAALGIIDATLTLVAIIMFKMYLQKNPKTDQVLFINADGSSTKTAANEKTSESGSSKKGLNILLVLLGGFLLIQVLASLVFGIAGQKAAKNVRNINNQTTQQTNTVKDSDSTKSLDNSTYSYETDFVYGGYEYSCTRTISGTWSRVGSASGGYSEGDFEYVPNVSSTYLAKYCTRNFAE